MNKKICVTSYYSAGCTFVDWSLHFLSGQSQYYHAGENKWIPLSQNPITKINAHGHNKNCPSGFFNAKSCIEKFDTLPDNGIYSMYAVKPFHDVAAKELKIPIDQIHQPVVMNQLLEFINNDYDKMLQFCCEQQVQLIFVSQDVRVALYHMTHRQLERYVTRPGRPTSEQDLKNEIQKVFFKNSISQWKELNLTEIWDVRERMALDIRPLYPVEEYKFGLKLPHHWVNCLDLWTRTENTLKNIMNYLNLEIDADRWQSWLPICKAWQEQQLSLLEFCYNQPHIVESIVNNWYYEIDLTFNQEVLIQHFLIYQFGLNLKTWQLEKFPSNTQDLHKLLEPNIHAIPKIY